MVDKAGPGVNVDGWHAGQSYRRRDDCRKSNNYKKHMFPAQANYGHYITTPCKASSIIIMTFGAMYKSEIDIDKSAIFINI
jgi:hypothetical protein